MTEFDHIPPQPENTYRAFLTLREQTPDGIVDHLAISDFQPPLTHQRLELAARIMARHIMGAMIHGGEVTVEITPPSAEQLHDDIAADLYAGLQDHAPKLYTAADIRRNEDDEERMRGYNDAIDEFWTAIRGVFGYPEPEES